MNEESTNQTILTIILHEVTFKEKHTKYIIFTTSKVKPNIHENQNAVVLAIMSLSKAERRKKCENHTVFI